MSFQTPITIAEPIENIDANHDFLPAIDCDFVREPEIILPLAQKRIPLDLDDGVEATYQKSAGQQAKIPGSDKKEEH